MRIPVPSHSRCASFTLESSKERRQTMYLPQEELSKPHALCAWNSSLPWDGYHRALTLTCLPHRTTDYSKTGPGRIYFCSFSLATAWDNDGHIEATPKTWLNECSQTATDLMYCHWHIDLISMEELLRVDNVLPETMNASLSKSQYCNRGVGWVVV